MGVDAIALLDHRLDSASFDDFPNHVDWSLVCDLWPSSFEAPPQEPAYRRACQALAPALGSTLAVYLPDACDDRDEDTSLADFLRNRGAPAGSLKELFDLEEAERTGRPELAARSLHYVERLGE